MLIQLLAFSIDIAPRLWPLWRDLSCEFLDECSGPCETGMIWDVDEAAESARDRISSLKIPVLYVPSDDCVVVFHRDEIDGILEPNRDKPRDDTLSERDRFGDA